MPSYMAFFWIFCH